MLGRLKNIAPALNRAPLGLLQSSASVP